MLLRSFEHLLSRLRSFLATWSRRERFEDSLDEEVRFHIAACTADLIRSGIPRAEAVRRARVHFGSIEGVKDDCRQARGLRLADELEHIMSNIRLALRLLFKTPVVTGVAVLSLALGIGSNAAIFSLYSQNRGAPVAGRRARAARQPRISRTATRTLQARQRGRVRRGVQLPDVPRPAA